MSENMIKIIVDGFGGDHSPYVNVEGTVMALNEIPNLSIVMTGDEEILKQEFAKYTFDQTRLQIVHAPEVISCEDTPTVAIKQKKESSLVKAYDLLRHEDDIKGMVSIGSTGAVLVGSVLKLGRIKGVKRPAFCPILPTMNGKIVGICDSGANVDCDPINLEQFAVMGSLYIKKAYGVENPKVALLNIGVEETKGDALRKETYELIRNNESVNFVGNMESRDLLTGEYDLIVCDGFSGNVLLKSTEGTAMELMKLIKKIMTANLKNKVGAAILKKDIMGIKDLMDYNNYGGGVMLGVTKAVVKGHGGSKSKAIYNCIKQAYTMEKNKLCEAIAEEIGKSMEK
ncbi:MAG: phosphate acyltransferase PlsX [Bacilli bacterium]|nr:phosphate acyltransferase PlsX [Bacilli bacterium]